VTTGVDVCGPATPGRHEGPTSYGGPAMAQDFSKGDHVSWKSHGGEAEGTVQKKITEDTEAAGRKVRASSDDPQYEVESEKSGGTAVHKPSALTKD
jgi:hypothetical protein